MSQHLSQTAVANGFPAHLADEMLAAGVAPDHNIWTVIKNLWGSVAPNVLPLITQLIQGLLKAKPPAPTPGT